MGEVEFSGNRCGSAARTAGGRSDEDLAGSKTFYQLRLTMDLVLEGWMYVCAGSFSRTLLTLSDAESRASLKLESPWIPLSLDSESMTWANGL